MSINKYQLDLVLDPSNKTVKKELEKLLNDFDVKITEKEERGANKLAYPISKLTEGEYQTLQFEVDSQSIKKLSSKLNFLNGLLRYLITTVSLKSLKLAEQYARFSAERKKLQEEAIEVKNQEL